MNKMVFTEKDKFSIYQGFLYCLHSLSNQEKQEKSWIMGDYSSYTNFDEVYMCFMDPCEDILTWPELSTKQRQKLLKLYDMLENYDEYHPDNTRKTEKEICNDPEWHKTRTFARIVYDDLKNVKYVPDDK